jgi:hypothetical protein
MSLVNITPIMTSNTTPSPYVVSASSEFATSQQAWYAFNNLFDDCWVTNGIANGWIKIDFGSVKKIDAISLYARNDATLAKTESANNFILYGSNDNILYEQIISINNQALWTIKEGRLYRLPASVTYRYYKLILNNNGGTNLSISEVKLWQDDGATTTVTNVEASMDYCLPKNSTLAMNQRQNDNREGLLGFANDGDNYGTLWMINHIGKAQIPMAGVKYDVLFDGIASTSGIPYSLSKPFTKYKSLIIMGGFQNGSRAVNVMLIPVKSIAISNATNDIGYSLSSFSKGDCYYYCDFYFDTEESFVINAISNAWWTGISISKVYGMY